ncbi:helix-turn-helix domain-containing protein [Actinomadura welshii]|uniref:helix-turn-helix domain-containing protein n=1 Tax=Actinomadura welshii TaxID=3103817 RepID=UPI000424A99A|nr:helix-turn-helix domain-containing protein [Actinomadura madurae]
MIGERTADSGWMNAAADVLRALNADESLESLLGRIARHTCALARFDSCSVMLLDDSGERLVARASHALTEGYRHELDTLRALRVNPATHEFDVPATQAVRERRTVVLSDVRELDANSPWLSAVHLEGIKSILAVPLGADEGCTGVLVGYTRRIRRFGASELALAELMAQYAAIVLKTAALREAEQRTIARLQETNAQLTAAVENLRQERGRREWAEEQDRRLVRLLVDDVGLDGVLEALAKALEASVMVEIPEDGAVLGQARGPRDEAWPTARNRSERDVRLLAEMDEQRVPVHVDLDDAVAWVVPVATAGEVVARLWVIRSRETTGTDVGLLVRPVIERFSLLVALELLKRRYAIDTELRLTRDLAVELVTGSGSERDLAERARVLGHDLSRPHTVVLIPLADGSGVSGGRRGAAVARAQLTARLAEPVLVGEHEGALVTLVPGAPDNRPALASALADLAVAHGAPRRPTVIGPTVHAVADYPSAWRMLRGAAALAGERGSASVFDLDDLGVAVLLLEAGTPDSLRGLADRRLGPVEEHDASRETNLAETLRVWLRMGCSTAEAARALHVHPHTIGYRLRRVAELTGLDPQHQEDVFELRVAVMVREVQRAGGAAA